MYYIMYLTGLCNRRNWGQPKFEDLQTRHGYRCTVRVNNREYTTDEEHPTPELAKEAAATNAYMICRFFSHNNGMYPDQHERQGGTVQGLPVAIGTGRNGRHGSTYEFHTHGGLGSPASDSGSASDRRSSDGSMVAEDGSAGGAKTYCPCGRKAHRAFDHCVTCLTQLPRR